MRPRFPFSSDFTSSSSTVCRPHWLQVMSGRSGLLRGLTAAEELDDIDNTEELGDAPAEELDAGGKLGSAAELTRRVGGDDDERGILGLLGFESTPNLF